MEPLNPYGQSLGQQGGYQGPSMPRNAGFGYGGNTQQGSPSMQQGGFGGYPQMGGYGQMYGGIGGLGFNPMMGPQFGQPMGGFGGFGGFGGGYGAPMYGGGFGGYGGYGGGFFGQPMGYGGGFGGGYSPMFGGIGGLGYNPMMGPGFGQPMGGYGGGYGQPTMGRQFFSDVMYGQPAQPAQQSPVQQFLNSPEYADFQKSQEGKMGTQDMYSSPYFGTVGSGSFGGAQDRAYEAWLAKNSQSSQKPATPSFSVIPEEGMGQFDPRYGKGGEFSRGNELQSLMRQLMGRQANQQSLAQQVPEGMEMRRGLGGDYFVPKGTPYNPLMD